MTAIHANAKTLTQGVGALVLCSLMLAAASGCGDDAGGGGETITQDGGAGDASTEDDSGNTQDGSTGERDSGAAPATRQTSLGSCEDEILVRDYPVTVTVTGLSAADGTPVWGWVSFGLDYDFCSVLGETEVKNGSFTLAVTATTTGGYVPEIAFWIDADRDGKCELESEVVFRGSPARGPREVELQLSSEDIEDSFNNRERETGCEPFERFVK